MANLFKTHGKLIRQGFSEEAKQLFFLVRSPLPAEVKIMRGVGDGLFSCCVEKSSLPSV